MHGPSLCDDLLPEGWYRFVGAAGTKMPTMRVPAFRCDTDFSGWLDGTHPTMEDDKVYRKVCFSDRVKSCKHTKTIFVKNCGSYFIYRLNTPPGCSSRYCSADWMWSKYTSRSKRIHKSLSRYMCIRFWHVMYSTFLLYRQHYQQILTLVANRYLFH